MPYERMTNAGGVERALDIWKRTLQDTSGAQTAVRGIGFPGCSVPGCEVIWLRRHPALEPGHVFWAHVGSWLSNTSNIMRTWTGYDCPVGDRLPSGQLTSKVEINPQVLSGFTQRFPDRFNGEGCILVKDDQPDRMFLARRPAHEWSRRITDIKRSTVHGREWLVLGDVAEQDTVANVIKFVQQRLL
jgi:hypothetical protein